MTITPNDLAVIITEKYSNKLPVWDTWIKEGLKNNYNIASNQAEFWINIEMPETIQGLLETEYDKEGWWVTFQIEKRFFRRTKTRCLFRKKCG